MTTKPLVAIAPNMNRNMFDMDCNSVTKTYTDAIEKGGGTPFILPLSQNRDIIRQLLDMADGILFVGGYDIDPKRYGEEPREDLMSVDPLLDEIQFLICEEAIARDISILGICRGAQVVNVAFGGTLVQDVTTEFPESTLVHMPGELAPSYGVDHEITLMPGTTLSRIFGESVGVNSVHHQAIRKLGKGLKLAAQSPDGVIEGAEHESRPVMVIQWHPEMMLRNGDGMLPLFEHFINECARNRQ